MENLSLTNSIVELYKKTATELPQDIQDSIIKAKEKEEKTSIAFYILNSITDNIKIAEKGSIPLCQDTGTPIFYIYHNNDISQKELKKAITEATKIATEKIPLRPNAVDPLTNENSKNNTGINFPVMHFEEHNEDFLKLDLMLKGGGSENIGMLYKLPDTGLNAGRDIDGIKKCVVDAVFKAQGKGCSPTIVGIGVGGSADECMKLAKKQFFRKLDDKNRNETLNNLEIGLLEKLNKLEIGPMGLGGKTTVLGVKAAIQHRHPASFFVAVAFTCWACRRYRLIIKDNKKIIE
ncbi:fumarate hydratase [Candidatus Woesearchaeota archaeon]|nr:fumarate hydratase [Candidatus Woesearchaeota archaeon]